MRMSETVLKLYESLIAIGFDEKLAETVSKRIMGEMDNADFATKTDLDELKAEMQIMTARLNMLTALNVEYLQATSSKS